MNAFSAWMRRVGLRPTDVAEALGIALSAISKYSKDGYWPKRDVAIRIRRFTGGQVSMDDLLADDVRPEESDEHKLAQQAMLTALERRKGRENGKARNHGGKGSVGSEEDGGSSQTAKEERDG